ncbi:MAG TPA: MFS transporter [Blastocatellia bacterium]|jgi:quinol monooxygenase YgiN|nr:MFS transporter [Blastocatellia bacterium]
MSASAWGPLREPIFRALWIASVASNIGSWLQDVGESWLMISLTRSPTLVALVETAGSLPIFLLALPAGALADVVDRRHLLIITQSWMLASAALMGAITLAGIVTPWLLLTLTFALGLGVAMNGPAWQAIIPEVEPPLEQGPVLVQVEYRIDPEQARGFRHAMRDLQRIRRRDGAIRWGLFRDPAEPGRFVESFVVESWAEHLRQHARATESDREIEERVQAFHIGVGRPAVTHLIFEPVSG